MWKCRLYAGHALYNSCGSVDCMLAMHCTSNVEVWIVCWPCTVQLMWKCRLYAGHALYNSCGSVDFMPAMHCVMEDVLHFHRLVNNAISLILPFIRLCAHPSVFTWTHDICKKRRCWCISMSRPLYKLHNTNRKLCCFNKNNRSTHFSVLTEPTFCYGCCVFCSLWTIISERFITVQVSVELKKFKFQNKRVFLLLVQTTGTLRIRNKNMCC